MKSPLELNRVWPENYSANSSQKVWGAVFAAHHPNVAVLDLSSFKCGHDAPTYGIVDGIVNTANAAYSALHDLDQTRPTGSIKIRIKTYAYNLQLRMEQMRIDAERVGALQASLERKRAEITRRLLAERGGQRAITEPGTAGSTG